MRFLHSVVAAVLMAYAPALCAEEYQDTPASLIAIADTVDAFVYLIDKKCLLKGYVGNLPWLAVWRWKKTGESFPACFGTQIQNKITTVVVYVRMNGKGFVRAFLLDEFVTTKAQ